MVMRLTVSPVCVFYDKCEMQTIVIDDTVVWCVTYLRPA